MTKKYIVYCDESDKKGKYYSNFYGGALIDCQDLSYVQTKLNAEKERLGIDGEVKWTKVSPQYCSKYVELMNCFFQLLQENKIKIRIMYTHNVNVPKGLTRTQIRNQYFLLYYQFLKHSFGLQYAGDGSEDIHVKLCMDQYQERNSEYVANFKNYVTKLTNFKDFKAARVHIPIEEIKEINSKNHVVLQCLDIVLGAMCFRLNDKFTCIPKGRRVRAMGTRKKEELYKHIIKKVRELHSGFNIKISTGLRGPVSNSWSQPYSHWILVPKDYTIKD